MDNLAPHFKAYKENGFCIINKLFSLSLIDKLIEAINDIQSNAKNFPKGLKKELVFECNLNPINRGGVPANYTGDAIFIIGDPVKFNPLFEQFLNNDIFYHIGKYALDTDNLIYHFMNVTIKHPLWGRSINWHRDFPNKYICTADSTFFRLMVCLDGMDDHNGATCVIPRSQLVEDQDLVAGSDKNVDKSCAKTIICEKGDIVLLHPKILHSSPINTTNKPRRNVIIQIGNGLSTLITEGRETITGKRLAI